MKFKSLFSKDSKDDEDSGDWSRPLSQVHSDEAENRSSTGTSANSTQRESQWGGWSEDASSEAVRRRSHKDELVPLNDRIRSNGDDLELEQMAQLVEAEASMNHGSFNSFHSADGHNKKKPDSRRALESRAKSIADLRLSHDDHDAKKKARKKKKMEKDKTSPSKQKRTKSESAIHIPSSTDSHGSGNRSRGSRTSASNPGVQELLSHITDKEETSTKDAEEDEEGRKRAKALKKAKKRGSSKGPKSARRKSGRDRSKSRTRSKSRNRSASRSKQKRSKADTDIMTNLSEITDDSPMKSYPSTPPSPGKKKRKEKKSSTHSRSFELNTSTDSLSVPRQIFDAGKDTLNGESPALGVLSDALARPSASYPNGDDEGQRQEILRLQHQLSEALQKVVSTTEEHIRDKAQHLEISSELTRLQASFEEVVKERDEMRGNLEERENDATSSLQKVDNLEQAIMRQMDRQDELEAMLERSEDENGKLLIEIKDLESVVDGKGGTNNSALRLELKEAKKELIDKQRKIEDQSARIEHLEKDLENSVMVNRLQIEELEGEKTALQGRLKGERLDYSVKLNSRDKVIGDLQAQLAKYQGDSDAQDAADVREILIGVRKDLESSQHEAEVATQMYHKEKIEKDELLERNNLLNDKVKILEKNVKELTEKSQDLGEKVIQLTEKTFDWKSRAENAERRVGTMGDSDGGSDAGSIVNEAPQGLFLQSVMDKQQLGKKKSRWSVFNRSGHNSDGEELSPEEIRIKELEKRNESLDETIAELRSEIVKLQSAHKDEAYSIQKKITQLEGENEALLLRNQALAEICDQGKDDAPEADDATER